MKYSAPCFYSLAMSSLYSGLVSWSRCLGLEQGFLVHVAYPAFSRNKVEKLRIFMADDA